MFRGNPRRKWFASAAAAVLCFLGPAKTLAQVKTIAESASRAKAPARPSLLVVLVVDQMRADYVDKFRGQWTGGLKRLVEEGAWFRNAAYPYAATETCVGHATISTGTLPATHGIVANAWWDRDAKSMVTCTADPNAKNVGYAGLTVTGGDSAVRLLVPTFADELHFQSGGPTRVVSVSLKARAAIMLAGHGGDSVTWFDPAAGAWSTSDAYGPGPTPFVEEYAKAHPAKEDLGKAWTLSLPPSAYLYDQSAGIGVAPTGWLNFPHALHGASGGTSPDRSFYEQWETSPYADTALVRLAEKAVNSLSLGKNAGTDYLGISFSSVDYVGHAFGPRSHEIQDILIHLDRDLAEFFSHLDKAVGRGSYVVVLTADHGVAPIVWDMQNTGADAGWLKISELQQSIEKALEAFNYPKPAVARVTGGEIYFVGGLYDQLKQDPGAMHAVLASIRSVPGIETVYRSEELNDLPATQSPLRSAEAASYFPGRSGDLLFVPKPYWPYDFFSPGPPQYGTTHGTPHYYDQRVPILLMGWGIQPGEYFNPATPADIAPTLASLCGITLSSRDGRVLDEALKKRDVASRSTAAAGSQAAAKP